MNKNQRSSENDLNKKEPHINRGFELMLRQHSRREIVNPKTFFISFGKMISLLNREIHIYFDFGLDIKKK